MMLLGRAAVWLLALVSLFSVTAGDLHPDDVEPMKWIIGYGCV
jgi:hypothetical protein